MTIKHRLEKLAQQAAQTYPRPPHMLSAEERKARILKLLNDPNRTAEFHQSARAIYEEIIARAKKEQLT